VQEPDTPKVSGLTEIVKPEVLRAMGGDVTYVYHENGLLPPDLKAQLTNWPSSGSGNRYVHRHIMTLANRLRHYIPAEQAVELIKAGMPRGPKGREVEETVERAYNIKDIPKRDRPPDLIPDVKRIGQILEDRITGKSALADLEATSPSPIPASTGEALHQLFNPDDLICSASDYRRPVTRRLRQMMFGNNVDVAQYVAPNPMSAPYVLDGVGKRHYRTLANTGPRKFIVCDMDIKPGNPMYTDLLDRCARAQVTVQDVHAALIGLLAEKGPLSMVVYSGHESLQGWFYCAGERETLNSPLRAFFETAVILGADPAGWTRCQLFRMPGALRAETGRRQTIHYFNPQFPIQGEEDDQDEDS
jgi:hypothetical protein